MEYDEFIREVPNLTRQIIERAMDIYGLLECQEFVHTKKISKMDKMVGSLFLASLMEGGSCQKGLNDAGLTKEPVLDYFGIDEVDIQKLKVASYRDYYLQGFLFLFEQIQDLSFDMSEEVSNRMFFAEYIPIRLMMDEFYCSGIIGDLFEAAGWGIREEIPNHRAVDILSMFLRQNLRLAWNQEEYDSLVCPEILTSQTIRKLDSAPSEILQQYGEYLTNQSFLSNPAIGRESELKQLMLSILTPSKASILVGEAGVGKTAIVKGLAYLIQRQQVPDLLKDFSIVQINISKIVSGSIYRGMLEERLDTIMEELQNQPKTILFIDEIHNAVGGGSSSEDQLDIANILKLYLEDGRVNMIGATTIDEYERFVMEDSAFKRRFERITIEEPKKEVVRQILQETIPRLEQVTHVCFAFEPKEETMLLESLVTSTDKKYRDYYDAVNNPDLALSILEKSFAYAAFEGHSTVHVDHVAESIRMCDRLAKDARNYHADQLLRRFESATKEQIPVSGKLLVFPNKKK